ncbi:hypothetical protein EOD39_13142 [Acipenser ruthenus]|uniref:Uncharacterized protein n=1 Tax=Acipenser ruthenus TaxID=7906 RepID=A0A662YRE7_ACIRT|nr:hypothetical protein EOD39_13142 [Acipenser ruthenus]
MSEVTNTSNEENSSQTNNDGVFKVPKRRRTQQAERVVGAAKRPLVDPGAQNESGEGSDSGVTDSVAHRPRMAVLPIEDEESLEYDSDGDGSVTDSSLISDPTLSQSGVGG